MSKVYRIKKVVYNFLVIKIDCWKIVFSHLATTISEIHNTRVQDIQMQNNDIARYNKTEIDTPTLRTNNSAKNIGRLLK